MCERESECVCVYMCMYIYILISKGLNFNTLLEMLNNHKHDEQERK